MNEKNTKSYWIDSTEDTNFPSLDRDIHVDVAIVGAGISGITCAYLLKQEGVKLALIDSDKIAKSTSGHTTAKLTSQHDLIYSKLINSLGNTIAKEYADANEKAIELVNKLSRNLKIDCDLEKLPAYVYTEDKNYIHKIEDEVGAAVNLGLKASYVNEIPLNLPIKAGICFEDQYQFHPRKYLLGLSKEISSGNSTNDCSIFENTAIVDVEYGNPCVLTSKEGKKITCSKVILCSHFPFYDGFGLYFARLKPERSYIVCAKSKDKFPTGMFINAETPTRSLRRQKHNDGELILIAGENHRTAHGENTINHFERLKEFGNSLFQIEDFPYSWSAQDYTTLDYIPYVGNLTSSKKNIYVAAGFRKWGMTNGTASAMIIRDLIINGKSPWQNAYSPSRTNFTASAKNFINVNSDTAKHLVKGKLTAGEKDAHVSIGEGTVVEIDGKKYGVYRDSTENLHIVDTTCTHMGCELNWNAAEKSWDCPCHGSRFSYEGHVIEGPATRDLNHYKESPNKISPNIL